MALSDKLISAFNDQINLEFVSAYAYLGMSTWCDEQELSGFARWLRAQAGEETSHAYKFIRFLLDRDARVELHDIRATTTRYGSVLDVYESALAHERTVTAAIGELYALATEERDYASLPLLNWFTDEQIEEEATVRQIVADLVRVSNDSAALMLLDREIAARDHGGGGADGTV